MMLMISKKTDIELESEGKKLHYQTSQIVNSIRN